MNGYNFTERVRRVLMTAREESIRRHHRYVGPEHILLGLLGEGDGVAAVVLRNHQIDLDALNRTVAPGTPGNESGPDLPYSQDGKRVLEFAIREARRLQHSYVGTEHLLLGVLSVKGVTSEFLRSAGITVESAREEIVALLGSPISAETHRQDERGSGVPESVTVIVEYAGGALRARKFVHAHDAVEYLTALGR
jgi:ATP-dependent Clp protease ATP-binding subunit ClpC